MIAHWRGSTFLVYGDKAFESIRTQYIPYTKIQQGTKYGIFILKNDNVRPDIFQLFGGEPVLVVNAQHYKYQEIISMTQTRTVWISPDFPYWHSSFKVENPPCKNVVQDKEALQSLCMKCFGIIPSRERNLGLFSCGDLRHTVCSGCFEYEWTCYHAIHKREYIPFEQAMQYDGLENMEMSFCIGGGDCVALVNPDVVCIECGASGFCSQLCLRLNHEC